MLYSSNLPDIIQGDFLQFYKDYPITHLSTDSRKIIYNQSSLFFAIHGKIHNGHTYIEDLYNNNIRQFIIEEQNFDCSKYPEANFYICDSSIYAIR